MKAAVMQQSEEDKEVDRRKSNIIIYKIEEVASVDGKAVAAGDKEYIKELCEGPLELTAADIVVHTARLGERKKWSRRTEAITRQTSLGGS